MKMEEKKYIEWKFFIVQIQNQTNETKGKERKKENKNDCLH